MTSRTVTFDVERLLALWSEPMSQGAAAEDAFRELYHDPVTVNGVQLTAADLVARAAALQLMLTDVHREVLDIADAGDKVAVAFRLSGRLVGPMTTPVGVIRPTGQHISLRVIDILTFTDGRISSLHMVADEIGALAPLGVLAVAD